MVSPSGHPRQCFPGDLAEQLRTARSAGGAFQVSPQLLVRLSGKDAFRYLHGQVTRDLSRLPSGEAFSACLLTPRGKLCATLLIRRDGEDLIIEANPALEEALIARLERYIVADDVTHSVDPAVSVVHLFGEAVPASGERNALRVTRLGVPGWDVFPPSDEPEPPRRLFDPRVVEALRIERGIPEWGREITEETLPPEAGLDRTHIDYDRGCYPGQEVISRIRSVGRVNRLLHRLTSEPGASLRQGMTIQNDEGKTLGFLSSASEQFDTGSWVGLAILPRGVAGTLGAAGVLFALDPLTGKKTPISISEITGP